MTEKALQLDAAYISSKKYIEEARSVRETILEAQRMLASVRSKLGVLSAVVNNADVLTTFAKSVQTFNGAADVVTDSLASLLVTSEQFTAQEPEEPAPAPTAKKAKAAKADEPVVVPVDENCNGKGKSKGATTLLQKIKEASDKGGSL